VRLARDDLPRTGVERERGLAVQAARALEGHEAAAGRAGEGAHRAMLAGRSERAIRSTAGRDSRKGSVSRRKKRAGADDVGVRSGFSGRLGGAKRPLH
jgi:hypothetical protein